MIFQLLIVLVSLVSINGFLPSASNRLTRSSRLLMAERIPFIAGNWKMNTDLQSAIKLAADVAAATKDVSPRDVEIAVCPPYPFIRDVQKALEGSNVKVGAQNSYYQLQGAYTGAVSAPMLASCGIQYSLVGHSERRAIFGDTDKDINLIVGRILEAGLTPILCIGETKEEYDLKLNAEVCTLQLAKDLKGLTPEQVSKIVIAYEPVWAIGTGLTATPEIAQNVHYSIRKWLRSTYGDTIAEMIRIQYGGSVTPETVDELMAMPDIDGALVGGASLKADSFSRIVKFKK